MSPSWREELRTALGREPFHAVDYFLIELVSNLSGGRIALPYPLAMLLVLGILLGFISINAMVLIWLERKVSARIQNRLGPMMTGPRALARISMWTGGLLQTMADAVKLLMKEDIIAARVDRLMFTLAPALIFAASLAAYVVIPFAPGLAVADLNIGLLYVVAVPSLTVLSILMAGWASNNKYSLLGGMRSGAQMLSYEIPLLFALLGPMVLAGTLSMQGIVRAQQELGLWFAFPSFIGFAVYFVAAIAEVNRPPFDLPEAESELVAGYVSEYSGMKFAMFFLAEFSNMMLVAMVATTAFLGGWTLPGWTPPPVLDLGFFAIPRFELLAGLLVFLGKSYLLVLVMMWIRWTFPRLRPDQLMNFGWKVLLPAALLNLFVCTSFSAAVQGPPRPLPEVRLQVTPGAGEPR